ncbi:MAG: ATP-binding cassette domain-containing protein, partial [Erysipelotrichaceae bacterium]|nr:ATP-binding cassette domain-containing protein [Erysipelotrichaceae bacterium]
SYLTIEDVIRIMKCMYEEFNENDFRNKCQQFSLDTRKKIKELSTGMKAKLNVLLALSHKAKLLLLDEPTVGLDVLARDDVLGMIREYMAEDEDRAVLISSHISSDLETLCDDFYMIHDGKIIMHEDTDRLLSDYAIIKVSDEEYEKLDKKYLLKVKKEGFGYRCLSDQREFYLNNYPELVIERSGIDELIELMLRGE